MRCSLWPCFSGKYALRFTVHHERQDETQESPKAVVAAGLGPLPGEFGLFWLSLGLLLSSSSHLGCPRGPAAPAPFPRHEELDGVVEFIIYTDTSEVLQRGFVSLCAIGNRGLKQGWNEQQEMESSRGSQHPWGGAGGPWGLAGGPGPCAQLHTDPPRKGWLCVGCFAQGLQLHDLVALIIHTAWSWLQKGFNPFSKGHRCPPSSCTINKIPFKSILN